VERHEVTILDASSVCGTELMFFVVWTSLYRCFS